MEPVILESGKHAGKSLAQLMFTDYSWLWEYLKDIRRGYDEEISSQSPEHRQLEWLMGRGEDRVATTPCSIDGCNQPAAFVHVSYRSGADPGILVDQVYCKDHNPGDNSEGTVFVPLKFSSLLRFEHSRASYQAFLRALRSLLGAPEILTREASLDFFARGWSAPAPKEPSGQQILPVQEEEVS